jgi:hypothetical protein
MIYWGVRMSKKRKRKVKSTCTVTRIPDIPDAEDVQASRGIADAADAVLGISANMVATSCFSTISGEDDRVCHVAPMGDDSETPIVPGTILRSSVSENVIGVAMAPVSDDGTVNVMISGGQIVMTAGNGRGATVRSMDRCGMIAMGDRLFSQGFHIGTAMNNAVDGQPVTVSLRNNICPREEINEDGFADQARPFLSREDLERAVCDGPPENPQEGDIYMDSTGTMNVHMDDIWQSISHGDELTATQQNVRHAEMARRLVDISNWSITDAMALPDEHLEQLLAPPAIPTSMVRMNSDGFLHHHISPEYGAEEQRIQVDEDTVIANGYGQPPPEGALADLTVGERITLNLSSGLPEEGIAHAADALTFAEDAAVLDHFLEESETLNSREFNTLSRRSILPPGARREYADGPLSNTKR